jgi:hypothetical protein
MSNNFASQRDGITTSRTVGILSMSVDKDFESKSINNFKTTVTPAQKAAQWVRKLQTNEFNNRKVSNLSLNLGYAQRNFNPSMMLEQLKNKVVAQNNILQPQVSFAVAGNSSNLLRENF